MSNDTSLPLRRAILIALKTDSATTALVPADHIYPPQTPALPTWPFVRYGAITQLPFRGAGLDGSTMVGAVHAFAKGPGEDAVSLIGRTIAKLLDGPNGAGLVLHLEGGVGTAIAQHTGNTILQDPVEADAWHCVCNFEATVTS